MPTNRRPKPTQGDPGPAPFSGGRTSPAPAAPRRAAPPPAVPGSREPGPCLERFLRPSSSAFLSTGRRRGQISAKAFPQSPTWPLLPARGLREQRWLPLLFRVPGRAHRRAQGFALLLRRCMCDLRGQMASRSDLPSPGPLPSTEIPTSLEESAAGTLSSGAPGIVAKALEWDLEFTYIGNQSVTSPQACDSLVRINPLLIWFGG